MEQPLDCRFICLPCWGTTLAESALHLIYRGLNLDLSAWKYLVNFIGAKLRRLHVLVLVGVADLPLAKLVTLCALTAQPVGLIGAGGTVIPIAAAAAAGEDHGLW
eukprot:scaffold161509_cov18-Tisochrysis_lutea.AAC.2